MSMTEQTTNAALPSSSETTAHLPPITSTYQRTLFGVSFAELLEGWAKLRLSDYTDIVHVHTTIETGDNMANIPGVGHDALKIIHPNGAGESISPYRFDLLPPLALAAVARVMADGAIKYGESNWKMLPPQSHLNHAMQHIFAHTAGDTQEINELEHARHVATRILFWLNCLEEAVQIRDASIKIGDVTNANQP